MNFTLSVRPESLLLRHCEVARVGGRQHVCSLQAQSEGVAGQFISQEWKEWLVSSSVRSRRSGWSVHQSQKERLVSSSVKSGRSGWSVHQSRVEGVAGQFISQEWKEWLVSSSVRSGRSGVKFGKRCKNFWGELGFPNQFATMDLLSTKLLALGIMFVISFSIGLFPIKVRQWLLNIPGSLERSQIILSAFLCFGAGVLLGTTFLHILPETLEKVEDARNEYFIADSAFALGEFVFCCGFFFMYIIEEAVHTYVHMHSNSTGHHHAHHLYGEQPVRPSVIVVSHHSEEEETNAISHAKHHELQQADSSSGRLHTYSLSEQGARQSVIVPDQSAFPNHIRRHRSSTCAVAADFMAEETVEQKKKDDALKLLRSIFVMLALSIHGCLEGFALGLEGDTHDVWIMFGALTAHKVAIAFSLGMELLEKEMKRWHYVIYMILFSLASPIGGGVGALVYEYADSDTAGGAITVLILQGLSGGTIMYVIFCEILERERCKDKGRLWRMFALILGFTLMALLEFFGGHEHHDEDHSQTSDVTALTSAASILAGSVSVITNKESTRRYSQNKESTRRCSQNKESTRRYSQNKESTRRYSQNKESTRKYCQNEESIRSYADLGRIDDRALDEVIPRRSPRHEVWSFS
ncbi:Zinc/iron permease [Trinorchestia longiramus]|nr:Zinc/iron permease [Trinorchestia longiramus]